MTPALALGQNDVHTRSETLEEDIDLSSERGATETGAGEMTTSGAPGALAKSEPGGVLPADFAVLYETHKKPIFYLCLRMLGNPSAAEDAAHVACSAAATATR